MNEQQLIAAAQRGDVAVFNQLVLQYQGLVYRTAYRVLSDAEAAADATQDAFISAFKHLRSFRGGSFRAWLLRIVTNWCYDQLRAKRARPATSLDALSADPDGPALQFIGPQSESPQEYAERRELGETIQRGLDSLPDEQRMAVVLSDIEGFTYEEIADIMGTTVGTCKSRLSRGRARMRGYLMANSDIGKMGAAHPCLTPT